MKNRTMRNGIRAIANGLMLAFGIALFTVYCSGWRAFICGINLTALALTDIVAWLFYHEE